MAWPSWFGPATDLSFSTRTSWPRTICAWPRPRWPATVCSSGARPESIASAQRHERGCGGCRASVFVTSDATCSAAINAVFPHCLPHGHDVLGRHIGLDVVDGVEDESAAGSQIVNAPLHLAAHLLRGAVRQHALRVHAAAVKREVLAEVLLQLLRIHAG